MTGEKHPHWLEMTNPALYRREMLGWSFLEVAWFIVRVLPILGQF